MENLPAQVRDTVHSYMCHMYGIDRLTCRLCLIDVLKQVSEKWRNKRLQYWRYFVNLNTLVGYTQPRHDPSVVHEVDKWLYKDVVYSIDGHEDKFYRYFGEELDKLFATEWSVRDERASLREFLSRKDWNKGKAATTRSLGIHTGAKGMRRSKKTKTNTSYELEDGEVVQLMFSRLPQRLVLVQKQDIGGKLRNVVCGELSQNVFFESFDSRRFCRIGLVTVIHVGSAGGRVVVTNPS